MSPYISVIITAYNRKQYLLNAVSSAIDQSLPKDLYEIIVAKNFYDDYVDAKLNDAGIRAIYSDQKKSGAMVADALNQARGEIISFLDDDDEFVSTKLDSVFKAFALGTDYHYNNQKTMNDAGDIIGARIRPSFITNDKQKYLNFFIQRRLGFNNSSISVRRKIIEEEIEALKRINLSVDTFYLVCYLLHGNKLFYDGRPLTVYRVRQKYKNSRSQGLKVFADQEIKRADLFAQDYNLMLNITRGTPYEILPKFRLSWAKAMRAEFSIYSKKDIDEILTPVDFIRLIEFQPRKSIHWSRVILLQWLPKKVKQILISY
ncbi:MAG: glycosyltransferase [Thermoprotei archaeon]